MGTFNKSQKTNEATELTVGKTAATAVMGLWVVERDSLSSISLSEKRDYNLCYLVTKINASESALKL